MNCGEGSGQSGAEYTNESAWEEVLIPRMLTWITCKPTGLLSSPLAANKDRRSVHSTYSIENIDIPGDRAGIRRRKQNSNDDTEIQFISVIFVELENLLNALRIFSERHYTKM